MAWTLQSKNTSDFTLPDKNTGAWSNPSKNTSDFSLQDKNSSSWNTGIGYLLQQIAAYILQENGGKIVLEESTAHIEHLSWTPQPKSA